MITLYEVADRLKRDGYQPAEGGSFRMAAALLMSIQELKTQGRPTTVENVQNHAELLLLQYPAKETQ